MALNYNEPDTGPDVATESIASQHYQQVKLVDGTAASTTVICAGGGVEAGALRVTIASDSTGVVSVDDNGSSLTVDAPVGTPVFVRLSDGSSAITTLPVSLASVPSHAVTNAGTFAVQVDGAALTALQLIDDPVFTDDAAFTPATSKVMVIGFQVDDTGTDSVDEGDAGAARMSANRCQYVMIRDNAGNERGLNIDASGYLTANINGTVTVGSHNVTNAGTFAVQAVCTNAGTFAVQDATAQASLSVMDDWDNAASDGASVSGDVAHDTADAGEPVKVGFKATAALSAITLVTDNDRTNGYAGLDGVQIVRPNCNLEDVVQERTTNTDGASTAFASGLAAPGANVRLWIKNVTICNSSASFCTVDLRDGSAGSVLWTLPVPATGGVTHCFDPPLKLTANTALAFDASAATSTLTISANGFKSKV